MRLGLDIGTNSIGWFLYRTSGNGSDAKITGVIDAGVRIFSDGRDPKSGTSLAVDRREARSARRRRDRYLRRRATLMKILANAGLMPADPAASKALEALDPYAVRAKGLDEALPLTHLGRALFHLNQRRGFKSNRKTDRGDNEGGKIKDATARLDQAMMAVGARTYGEFLQKRRSKASDPRKVPTVRTRLSVAKRDNAEKEEAGYDFYPDRRHLEDEFRKLWTAQAVHHPEILTDVLRDQVFEKIFFQRPLKEPEVGLCLFTSEKRLPKAHPLTQRRVLYETVNSLRITADGQMSRPLTQEERDQVIHQLDNKKPTKTLSSMNVKLAALSKALKLPVGERFTLETVARDAVACDPVRASFSHPSRLGSKWSTLDGEAQWQVVQRIRDVQSDTDHAALVDWFMTAHGLDKEHAEASANAPLPEGYARLGLTATTNILDALMESVIPYSAAVSACGWHHSDGRTGEVLDVLPYYGEVLDRHVIPGTYNEQDDDIKRYGRITNPTVHIGLNQLRRLVNRIIDVHGKPDQIVVELARDLKQSEAQKRETQIRIKTNTSAAIKRSEVLGELGQRDNGHNRMILRLYEELGPAIGPRACPYTGTPISVSMLFDGSCDVDHILPYSRTLDDGFANRTLCLKDANREKRNQTPWECWGETSAWDVIAGNLKNLPANKQWRFAPDAMERFEGENSFLDRALVDTQYLSRLARNYLDCLYTEGGHVWTVNGRLTEMLRRHWGLNFKFNDNEKALSTGNAKNRSDHRHHAIDAAVVAATDRGIVKRISDAAAKDEGLGHSAEDVARRIEAPWESFRDDVRSQVARIVVSHRSDHGRIDPEARKKGHDSTSGRLHNDTAYGIVDDQSVVSRVPLLSLKPGDIATTVKGKNIRDGQLQAALTQATLGKEGKELENALREFASKPGPYQGIRRVRLVESLQESVRVEIDDREGRPLKAYKGDSNHCYELWRLPDGTIKPQVITTFEAHGKADRKPHPAAKRILRLFKRDMVMLNWKGDPLVCYVQKLDLANGLFLAPHNESNADARNRDKSDPFRLVQIGAKTIVKTGLRRVFVDEIGQLRDPGLRS